MERKRKFRQESFITNAGDFDCYLVLIEYDENDLPIKTYLLEMPLVDGRFKIYPYLKN